MGRGNYSYSIFTRWAIFSAFLLGQSMSVDAQRHFQPGYVVLQNGDSSHGWIRCRERPGAQPILDFKSEENGPIRRLTPTSVARFGSATTQMVLSARVYWITYKGFLIPLGIGFGADTSQTQARFLRVLATGRKICLYQLLGQPEAFYTSPANRPDSLTPLEDWTFHHQGTFPDDRIDEVKLFQNQLAAFASHRDSVLALLPALEYDKNQLIEIVNIINGAPAIIKSFPLPLHHKASLWVGPGLARIQPGYGDGVEELLSYHSRLVPKIGSGLDIPLKGAGNRTYMRFEAGWLNEHFLPTGGKGPYMQAYQPHTMHWEAFQFAISLNISVLPHPIKNWGFYFGPQFSLFHVNAAIENLKAANNPIRRTAATLQAKAIVRFKNWELCSEIPLEHIKTPAKTGSAEVHASVLSVSIYYHFNLF